MMMNKMGSGHKLPPLLTARLAQIFHTLAVIFITTIAVRAQVVAAQPDSNPSSSYKVTDIGTLGGPFSSAEGISNRGWVSGLSSLPGDAIVHAFAWRDGVMSDLGTPGLNSVSAYPFNERGELALHGEVSTPDPLGEDFCGFGTHLGCSGFVWQRGVLTNLATLGGNNAHANFVNNRGQVAGIAENTTPDATCDPQYCVESLCPAQVLQSQPVVWTKGRIKQLPTLLGDPDGIALMINDKGQVAGTSGKCIGSSREALHMLFWQNDGTVTDLGNLGGSENHHPQYINNRGEVVGSSNLPGDETSHAFLWRNEGGMIDLGTLPGDIASFGEAISESGVVGGFSCDPDFNCRAFIWHSGTMTDLNTLLPAGGPLLLISVWGINSRGDIVGDAVELSTGEVHGYVATPSNGEDESARVAAGHADGRTPKVVLSDTVRKMLRRRAVRHSQLRDPAGIRGE
jgi:probable HAF family extracellular repeat protein